MFLAVYVAYKHIPLKLASPDASSQGMVLAPMVTAKTAYCMDVQWYFCYYPL